MAVTACVEIAKNLIRIFDQVVLKKCFKCFLIVLEWSRGYPISFSVIEWQVGKLSSVHETHTYLLSPVKLKFG